MEMLHISLNLIDPRGVFGSPAGLMSQMQIMETVKDDYRKMSDAILALRKEEIMVEENNGTAPEQELIEQLADKEHASWARWMRYLFNVCEAYSIVDPDGFTRYKGVLIPAELVERWEQQIDTPYAELSEQEKQSDRNEVAHILPIIKEYHR